MIEKRDHIGGNAHDFMESNGILIHKYGPHIFHTNSPKVWEYLSQFTEWRPYEHKVLGVIEGKKVPIPFNLNTLHSLFSQLEAQKLEDELIRQYGLGAKVTILKLKESANQELKSLAEYVYNNIFFGYTKKQWELTPEQLSPSVTARVPVCINRDDRYFQDKYQAMPKNGFTQMFNKILSHKNIHIACLTEYRDVNLADFKKVIFTGPIDEYFSFVYGELPYRSLTFELQYHEQQRYQEVGTVNFPNDFTYTRITEFKHLTGQQIKGTVTATEYPEPYRRGKNIPYYPIPRDNNSFLLQKYQNEIEKLKGTVLFAGRLAEYMYYNMDQAAARALSLFEKEIGENA